MALIEYLKKIHDVAGNSDRSVRVVMSGQPHPSDEEGMRMFKDITSLSNGELKEMLVYLPSYNMELAKLLVAGCDVWLNTPVVGFEVSGTSGMKAALNGVLPLSTKDGWIDEIDIHGKGWLINSENMTIDLGQIIDEQIKPLYYDLDSKGIPIQWEEKMRNSRQMILNDFSATRMVREYVEMLYV